MQQPQCALWEHHVNSGILNVSTSGSAEATCLILRSNFLFSTLRMCPFYLSLLSVPFVCPFYLCLSYVFVNYPFCVSILSVPFICALTVFLFTVPFICPIFFFCISLLFYPFYLPLLSILLMTLKVSGLPSSDCILISSRHRCALEINNSYVI